MVGVYQEYHEDVVVQTDTQGAAVSVVSLQC